MKILASRQTLSDYFNDRNDLYVRLIYHVYAKHPDGKYYGEYQERTDYMPISDALKLYGDWNVSSSYTSGFEASPDGKNRWPKIDVWIYSYDHPEMDHLDELEKNENWGPVGRSYKNNKVKAGINTMKRFYVKASVNWPDPSYWEDETLDVEDAWDTYFCDPEEAVNDELNIVMEPAVQGGMGSMFLYDDTGEHEDTIEIDFDDWCQKEIEMAIDSSSSNEYKTKYRNYLKSLINEYWS